MRKEINLLPKELKEEKKVQKIRSSLGSLSLIFLILVAGLSFLSSALLVNLKLRQSGLNKEMAQTSQKIRDLGVVESEAARLENKLSAANKIFEQKKLYSKLLGALSSAAPKEMIILSLSTFGENRVSLTGLAQSYFVLSQFIGALVDPASGGKVFAGADLTSASLDEVSGKIRFSMILYLKSDGLKL